MHSISSNSRYLVILATKRGFTLETRMRKSLIAGILMAAILGIAPFALSQIQTAKVTGNQLQGVDSLHSTPPVPQSAA
jgi:hypothetical protein